MSTSRGLPKIAPEATQEMWNRLKMNQPCWLGFGFPASRSVRQCTCVEKPPSLGAVCGSSDQGMRCAQWNGPFYSWTREHFSFRGYFWFLFFIPALLKVCGSWSKEEKEALITHVMLFPKTPMRSDTMKSFR